MLILLALLGQLPAAETPAPEVYVADIVRAPYMSPYDTTDATVYVQVEVEPDCSYSVNVGTTGKPVAVVWHYDHNVRMSLADLQPGTRVRLTGPSVYRAEQVEVIGLGPLAMAVAVEEWVIAQAGGRLAEGLSASEMAVASALASPSWLVRESVTRTLREKGPRVLRLLCWLRASRDAEVRERAEALLARLGWSR
jgi:hypothetical protein